MEDKINRMTSNILKYSKYFNSDSKLTLKAAMLCKADLCSEVVYEMPELQGKIGGIYATKNNMPEEVSIAIKEQYSPLGPSDKCPSIPEASLLSFSDKIDSLIGFIAMDMKATGSKDPFGLRRSCLGVIRILLENKIRVSIDEVIDDSYDSFKKYNINLKLSKLETNKYATEFIYERLRVFLRDKGLSQSVIQAIFGVSKYKDILDDVNRIYALNDFMENKKGKEFFSILKRVRRIVSIEEKRDNKTILPEPEKELFELNEEKDLFKSYIKYSKITEDLIVNKEYIQAMETFSQVSSELENFFENVQVNVKNTALRNNRLKLLAMIRGAFLNFADFSLIEAENEVK
tara:strand:+ start:1 stop:1038 length:1038 start_codon:yes stop_codon:yes gene_type:complete